MFHAICPDSLSHRMGEGWGEGPIHYLEICGTRVTRPSVWKMVV